MRIFALAFLLCLASVSEAAQMPLSVLPGGAVVFKPLQSVRERKFADLVQQKTDFSCGAAALATILRQPTGWMWTNIRSSKACWPTLTRTWCAHKASRCST